MKFKKDGMVFSGNIEYLRCSFCEGRTCADCPLWGRSNDSGLVCDQFCQKHPAEAARLMGYEVVGEEKEVNMDNQKPLKDWTLGEVQEYCRRMHGYACYGEGPSECLLRKCKLCCNEPQEMDLSERPRFTEEEVADARAIVRLFGPDGWTHIGKTEDGYPQLEDKDEESEIVVVNVGISSDLFPSIQPGESYKLSEIAGVDDG